MCNNRSSFLTYERLARPTPIKLADETVVMAYYHGRITVFQGYCANALHTPTFRMLLLSISQLDDDGFRTIFSNGQCSMKNLRLKVDGNRSGGIYTINNTAEVCFTIAAASPASSSAQDRHSGPNQTTEKIKVPTRSLSISESAMWHKRLGHLNHASTKSLIQGYTHDNSLCDVCILAKHQRKIIRIPVKKTSKPFELVHSDLC